MRISSAVLLALPLAACGTQADRDASVFANAHVQAASDEKIDCAPAGTREFALSCTVDRAQSAAGVTLTVRNPDGGFHRLQVVSDGRGVIAADGAEAATVTVIGDGRIEVAIGGDRYRLPATVKAKAAQ